MTMRLTLAAAALALLAAAPATAQLAFTSRSLTAQVNTPKPGFSGATMTTIATTQVTSSGAASRSLDFFTLPILTGTTASGQGGVAISNVKSSPTSVGGLPGYEITAVASSTDTGTGSFTFTNQFAPEADGFSYAYFYGYPDDGMAVSKFADPSLSAVEVYLYGVAGAGLVDQGGQFLFKLTIPGNFSKTGGFATGTGEYFLNSFNDYDWEITNDFTYDPATNLTSFSAINRNYDYFEYGTGVEDQPSLGLDVYFFTAAAGAVPEPATWAMMIVGVGLIGGALRRCRSRTALPAAMGRFRSGWFTTTFLDRLRQPESFSLLAGGRA